MAKQILEDAGYTVIEALDGEHVIDKFNNSKERIDLLLLDTVMPKKERKEVCRKISRIRPNIKALFMSGHSEEIIHKRGFFRIG